jgi:hypothetical protein
MKLPYSYFVYKYKNNLIARERLYVKENHQIPVERTRASSATP